MQEEQNSQKIAYKCRIHNQLVTAFSIDTQHKLSDRLLCTKCLVELNSKGVAIKQLIYLDDFNENPLKEILKLSGNDLQFDFLFEEIRQHMNRFVELIHLCLNNMFKIIDNMKFLIDCQTRSLAPLIDDFNKILREETKFTASIQGFLNHISYDIKNFHFKTKIKIDDMLNMQKIQDLDINLDLDSADELEYFINDYNNYPLSQVLQQHISEFQIQSHIFISEFSNKIGRIFYNPFQSQIHEFSDFPRIHELISNQRQIYYQLLYQGSIYGLNATSYWKNCDKQENLLTIIYLADGNIIGGFSPCQLNMNEQNYIRDDKMKSFLFSVNKKEIYPIKQGEFAIRCRPISGPTYGAGHDLAILDDFKRVYSNLGHSYDTLQIENIQNNHLLGDDPKMVECLVYKIIYM